MSLSKKHFDFMANEFGSILRDIDARFPHGSHDHLIACDYVREAVYSWQTLCKRENSQFDQARTEDWIADVRYGRRDLDGRKIA